MTGPPRDDDAAVVSQSLEQPETFALLYDRYAADIHRYAARRLGEGAADDITADTFLIAFRARARFDTGRESARPWLYGIAANLINGKPGDDHSARERFRFLADLPSDPVEVRKPARTPSRGSGRCGPRTRWAARSSASASRAGPDCCSWTRRRSGTRAAAECTRRSVTAPTPS
ncbi:sigma-70-like protein [Streptomyces sp. 840.1]|uniref:RNA polymerase sigma factor n=1 Tax=Streptomyces sp. 840.1 TaxID=2485152 RepID=UPI000FACB74B|nr:sigma-70 family RNA polymerase sigma factor [Streptomyces sp. 840.1]ROQ69861.1 sigma-70-like protein [Streptomyces sp. 840.1]